MTDAMRPVCSRRHWLQAALGAAAWPAAAWAQSEHGALPAPASLQEELAAALQQRQPLLVMVSLVGCPFCKVVRESYLRPMRDAGQPVVQVDMRDRRRLLDFEGQATTHDELIRRWGIRLAPTVLFFGPAAREVAPRLKGGYLPDFYNAYLEDNLAVARRAVRSQDKVS